MAMESTDLIRSTEIDEFANSSGLSDLSSEEERDDKEINTAIETLNSMERDGSISPTKKSSKQITNISGNSKERKKRKRKKKVSRTRSKEQKEITADASKQHTNTNSTKKFDRNDESNSDTTSRNKKEKKERKHQPKRQQDHKEQTEQQQQIKQKEQKEQQKEQKEQQREKKKTFNKNVSSELSTPTHTFSAPPTAKPDDTKIVKATNSDPTINSVWDKGVIIRKKRREDIFGYFVRNDDKFLSGEKQEEDVTVLEGDIDVIVQEELKSDVLTDPSRYLIPSTRFSLPPLPQDNVATKIATPSLPNLARKKALLFASIDEIDLAPPSFRSYNWFSTMVKSHEYLLCWKGSIKCLAYHFCFTWIHESEEEFKLKKNGFRKSISMLISSRKSGKLNKEEEEDISEKYRLLQEQLCGTQNWRWEVELEALRSQLKQCAPCTSIRNGVRCTLTKAKHEYGHRYSEATYSRGEFEFNQWPSWESDQLIFLETFENIFMSANPYKYALEAIILPEDLLGKDRRYEPTEPICHICQNQFCNNMLPCGHCLCSFCLISGINKLLTTEEGAKHCPFCGFAFVDPISFNSLLYTTKRAAISEAKIDSFELMELLDQSNSSLEQVIKIISIVIVPQNSRGSLQPVQSSRLFTKAKFSTQFLNTQSFRGTVETSFWDNLVATSTSLTSQQSEKAKALFTLCLKKKKNGVFIISIENYRFVLYNNITNDQQTFSLQGDSKSDNDTNSNELSPRSEESSPTTSTAATKLRRERSKTRNTILSLDNSNGILSFEQSPVPAHTSNHIFLANEHQLLQPSSILAPNIEPTIHIHKLNPLSWHCLMSELFVTPRVLKLNKAIVEVHSDAQKRLANIIFLLEKESKENGKMFFELAARFIVINLVEAVISPFYFPFNEAKVKYITQSNAKSLQPAIIQFLTLIISQVDALITKKYKLTNSAVELARLLKQKFSHDKFSKLVSSLLAELSIALEKGVPTMLYCTSQRMLFYGQLRATSDTELSRFSEALKQRQLARTKNSTFCVLCFEPLGKQATAAQLNISFASLNNDTIQAFEKDANLAYHLHKCEHRVCTECNNNVIKLADLIAIHAEQKRAKENDYSQQLFNSLGTFCSRLQWCCPTCGEFNTTAIINAWRNLLKAPNNVFMYRHIVPGLEWVFKTGETKLYNHIDYGRVHVIYGTSHIKQFSVLKLAHSIAKLDPLKTVAVNYWPPFSLDFSWERFRRLLSIHSALEHPNIIKCYGGYVPDNIWIKLKKWQDETFNDAQYQPFVVLEDYSRTLRQLMEDQQYANFFAVLRLALELAKALVHLHAMHLVFRGMSPDNVVVIQDERQNFIAKLFTFTTCNFTNSQPDIVNVTRPYRAPEYNNFFKPNQDVQGNQACSQKVDVYGWGRTLLEMCIYSLTTAESSMQQTLLDRFNDRDVAHDNCASQLWEQYLQYPPVMQVKNLIELCCSSIPDRRPSMLNIVSVLQEVLKTRAFNISLSTLYQRVEPQLTIMPSMLSSLCSALSACKFSDDELKTLFMSNQLTINHLNDLEIQQCTQLINYFNLHQNVVMTAEYLAEYSPRVLEAVFWKFFLLLPTPVCAVNLEDITDLSKVKNILLLLPMHKYKLLETVIGCISSFYKNTTLADIELQNVISGIATRWSFALAQTSKLAKLFTTILQNREEVFGRTQVKFKAITLCIGNVYTNSASPQPLSSLLTNFEVQTVSIVPIASFVHLKAWLSKQTGMSTKRLASSKSQDSLQSAENAVDLLDDLILHDKLRIIMAVDQSLRKTLRWVQSSGYLKFVPVLIYCEPSVAKNNEGKLMFKYHQPHKRVWVTSDTNMLGYFSSMLPLHSSAHTNIRAIYKNVHTLLLECSTDSRRNYKRFIALVARLCSSCLTHGILIDKKFVLGVLITLHSHIKPHQLLNLLLVILEEETNAAQRLEEVDETDAKNDAENEDNNMEAKKEKAVMTALMSLEQVICKQVTLLLELWFNHCSGDIINSDGLEAAVAMLEATGREDQKKLIPILQLHQARLKQYVQRTAPPLMTDTVFALKMKKRNKFIKRFAVEEIAGQLALISFSYFQLISPGDFVSITNSNGFGSAMKLYLSHCAKLSNWVVNTLYAATNKSMRASWFWNIAKKLFALRDFQSCYALVSGISKSLQYISRESEEVKAHCTKIAAEIAVLNENFFYLALKHRYRWRDMLSSKLKENGLQIMLLESRVENAAIKLVTKSKSNVSSNKLPCIPPLLFYKVDFMQCIRRATGERGGQHDAAFFHEHLAVHFTILDRLIQMQQLPFNSIVIPHDELYSLLATILQQQPNEFSRSKTSTAVENRIEAKLLCGKTWRKCSMVVSNPTIKLFSKNQRQHQAYQDTASDALIWLADITECKIKENKFVDKNKISLTVKMRDDMGMVVGEEDWIFSLQSQQARQELQAAIDEHRKWCIDKNDIYYPEKQILKKQVAKQLLKKLYIKTNMLLLSFLNAPKILKTL